MGSCNGGGIGPWRLVKRRVPEATESLGARKCRLRAGRIPLPGQELNLWCRLAVVQAGGGAGWQGNRLKPV